MKFDYNQYMASVRSACNAYPHWRYGQILFNVLHDGWPEIANKIRGTENDPFYEEREGERINKFFKEITK